jgi:hypothetical protein
VIHTAGSVRVREVSPWHSGNICAGGQGASVLRGTAVNALSVDLKLGTLTRSGGPARSSHQLGATDGFVTDFGHILSLFYRDPDGLEAEVCVANPDARQGVHNPPGTPSLRYHNADIPPPERLKDRPHLA